MQTNDDEQVQRIAAIIQHVRPDVLLLNEFDYDADSLAIKGFRENYLAKPQHVDGADALSLEVIDYPYVFVAPTNTGVPTRHDLDRDGQLGAVEGTASYARDAQGFGKFPGQYGMVLLSRHPLVADKARTFQGFLWRQMPGARLPKREDGEPWYAEGAFAELRLSSKSHWDVPVAISGRVIHVLASHPTPPVFDGPEDRNGCRNFDEVRFFVDYVRPSASGYITDDLGMVGGLPAGEPFVVLGDLNSDPMDGDGPKSVNQWLESDLIHAEPVPESEGGVDSGGHGEANSRQRGNAAADTSSFDGLRGPGNLRLDYVLVSKQLRPAAAGVFWPSPVDPLFRLLGTPESMSSDHRLVWVDVEIQDLPASSARN